MKYLEIIKTAISQDDSADEGEKLFLYGLVRAIKPTIAVETGTHRGVSALYIAHALHDNGVGHLYTADPYEFGQVDSFAKFPELSKFITYKRLKGKNLEVDNIDFLFIDSYHEREVVAEEIDALFPRLNKNAIVVFHDCYEVEDRTNGVNTAVREAGLKTVWIPTKYRLRIYEHSSF